MVEKRLQFDDETSPAIQAVMRDGGSLAPKAVAWCHPADQQGALPRACRSAHTD
jgi:hypothetical protein